MPDFGAISDLLGNIGDAFGLLGDFTGSIQNPLGDLSDNEILLGSLGQGAE